MLDNLDNLATVIKTISAEGTNLESTLQELDAKAMQLAKDNSFATPIGDIVSLPSDCSYIFIQQWALRPPQFKEVK